MSTRPDARVDKNGRVVTRHVRIDSGAKRPRVGLPSAPMSQVYRGANSNMGSNRVAYQCAVKASNDADSPDKLWENFDTFTAILESPFPKMGTRMIREENILPRLRDAWLNMHGADVSNPDGPGGYKSISGDDGYESYMSAHALLSSAIGEAEQSTDHESNYNDLFKSRTTFGHDGSVSTIMPSKSPSSGRPSRVGSSDNYGGVLSPAMNPFF